MAQKRRGKMTRKQRQRQLHRRMFLTGVLVVLICVGIYSGIRRVAYKGLVEDTVFQLIGGLRSGMGYCGAKDVETLKETGKFVKISAASLKESHPHDIHITKEAPNYSVDDK